MSAQLFITPFIHLPDYYRIPLMQDKQDENPGASPGGGLLHLSSTSWPPQQYQYHGRSCTCLSLSTGRTQDGITRVADELFHSESQDDVSEVTCQSKTSTLGEKHRDEGVQEKPAADARRRAVSSWR